MGTNNGNVGKKGVSGRKSYAQEKADYQMLESMFLAEMAKEDVQKKLASGKYSIKDVFVSKAFAGNEKFITAMFNKLFPDKTDIDLKVGRKSTEKLPDGEIERLTQMLYDNEQTNTDSKKLESGSEEDAS